MRYVPHVEFEKADLSSKMIYFVCLKDAKRNVTQRLPHAYANELDAQKTAMMLCEALNRIEAYIRKAMWQQVWITAMAIYSIGLTLSYLW